LRILLIAVWILLSSGAASAGWDEVMQVLEEASGPEYKIVSESADTGWVATRKARIESERARMLGANLETALPRDRSACRESTPAGPILHCD
jgi:hypothetical protein